MIGGMFRCLTPWTHKFGWPILDRDRGAVLEHCTVCGRERPADGVLASNSSLARLNPATATVETSSSVSKIDSMQIFPKSFDETVVE